MRAYERVPVARWGETAASDADREAVVDQLKRSYIDDRLSTEELSEHVASAREASTLRELEDLLRSVNR